MATEKKLLEMEIFGHELKIKVRVCEIEFLKDSVKRSKKAIKEKSDEVSDLEYSLEQLRKALKKL